jgi:hypothetical protein
MPCPPHSSKFDLHNNIISNIIQNLYRS